MQGGGPVRVTFASTNRRHVVLVGEDGQVENRVLTLPPGRAAKKVTMPILFCVSNTDSVTPPGQTLVSFLSVLQRMIFESRDAGH